MNKILNINDYKNIVYSLVGNEYTVLNTNSDRKLRNIIFNICNTKGYTQYLITEGNAHKPRYLV